MNDNKRMVLITVVVFVVLSLIVWFGLPQNPQSLEAAANKTATPDTTGTIHLLYYAGIAVALGFTAGYILEQR